MRDSEAQLLDDSIVQIVDSLGKNRGGLTRAVFDRFRVLAQGKRAVVATFSFQPDVREVFEDLKLDGIVPRHTELLNFHEHQRHIQRPRRSKAEMPHLAWEAGDPFEVAPEPSRNGTYSRYFCNGKFEGLVFRTSAGLLGHVEKHDPTRPWVREFRDSCWNDGSIGKREYYDDEGAVRFRIYLAADGRPYTSAWVSPSGYEYRAIEHADERLISHRDMQSAQIAWLSGVLAAKGPTVVFTDEPKTLFALSVSSHDVFHVTSIHTTHYKNNRDRLDGMKPWMKRYVECMDNVGKFVLFTETQRRDFLDDTGAPLEKTAVVAHAAPLEEAKRFLETSKNPLEFVTVSRLANDKRIQDAIRGFASHCADIPGAKYKIFGAGTARRSLSELIQELGVQDLVFLPGHTSSPLEAFTAASASILTSKFEGFGLVLTESFACGTPVIAYDVIYGPRDVVSTENGILVPDGDSKALGESMRRFLLDRELQSRLSSGAIKTAAEFSTPKWTEGWNRVYDEAKSTLAERQRS